MTLAKHPKRRQQQLPHLLGARQLGNDDASGQDNSADQQPETTISGVIDEGDNTALFTVTSTSTTGPSDATSDPSASTSSSSSASDDQSTRAGLIAGLCVGLTVVVVILAFVVWKCWKRGKSPSSSKQAAASRSLAADSKEALPMQDYAPFEHHSAQSRLGTSEKGPTPPPRSADAASSLYTISTAPPQSSSIPMPHQPPPAAAPQRPHDRYSRAASSKEQSRSNRNTRKSVVSWFSLNKPSVKDQFMWYRTSTGLDGDDEELQDRSLATGNAAAFEQCVLSHVLSHTCLEGSKECAHSGGLQV